MPKRRKFDLKLFSIVIPAFKQQRTIIRDIRLIEKVLGKLGFKYEMIVVVDGMVDKTLDKLKTLRARFRAKRFKKKSKSKNQELIARNLRIIYYPQNHGKGHAVRTGMLAARGDIIAFMDAGTDIDPSGFRMLLNHMEWYGADVIVGSKLHPVSQVRYPLYRRILSRGYRTITQLLFGFKVRDSQVGLKLFRKKVVRSVFPKLVVKKYAFDIEILAVSYLLGHKRIYEAPVKINFKENSINKKGLFKIVWLMLWDTAAVFYRIKFLNYYKNKK